MTKTEMFSQECVSAIDERIQIARCNAFALHNIADLMDGEFFDRCDGKTAICTIAFEIIDKLTACLVIIDRGRL